jgi:hypothetical protein
MRIRYTVPLCWVLVSCTRETPVPRVGDVRLDVSLGESLASVRSKRPQIRFAPYAGWTESFSRSRFFETAVYQFGATPASEKPSSGRLMGLRLIARDTSVTKEVVAELDSGFGSARYLGCTPVPGRNKREEIAVLGWTDPTKQIYLEVLVAQDGTAPLSIEKPPVVSFAARSGGEAILGVEHLDSHCFSRAAF